MGGELREWAALGWSVIKHIFEMLVWFIVLVLFFHYVKTA